jgi:predicted nucleic acid-binding Zn ribbon protein
MTLLAAVQRAWPDAVGDTIGGRRPDRDCDPRGTVVVSCQSTVWAQELTLMGPELVAKLNDRLEGRPWPACAARRRPRRAGLERDQSPPN